MASKAQAAPAAPSLPVTITLNAAYSGFRDDGSFYAYPAGSVVYDAADIAYFVGRDDTLYTPAAE